MKSPSQVKVSLISFIVALVLSILVFGSVAIFAISRFLDTETVAHGNDVVEEVNKNDPYGSEVIPPDEIEKIDGDSFSLLIAGYGLEENSLDAMIVLEVNKEEQKVTVYPINVDTKVYVGHADGMGNLNVRIGDLIKYEDITYVVDKIRATTGIKVSNYVTLTAEGFISAFDKFNEQGDYTYVVQKDMVHQYADPSDEELSKYNISFKKGDKLTSGIDIYNMLRYKGDSSSERLTRQTSFARDVIEKIVPTHFKEANFSRIITDVQAIVKLTDSVKTNISVGTFLAQTFELIAKLPEFSFAVSSKYTSGITNFK